MNRITAAVLAGITAAILTAPAGAQKKSGADTMFEAARQKESVEGDLAGAIKQYKAIIASHKNDRAVTAQAMVRMAECYQKVGDAESRKIYEQIVREYADQPAAVATAKARLGGSTVAKGEPTNRRLWTLPEHGGVAGQISRDGRYAPFVHWSKFGNLYLHDLVSGTDRQLTDTGTDAKPGAATEEYAEEAAISRDGTKVAYSWYRSDHDRYDLRVVDLKPNGIPPFRIIFDSEDLEWVSPDDWSPDGKWIAVRTERKDNVKSIGVLSIADGKLHILKSTDWRGPNRLVFSPDGKFVAFDLPSSDDTENRDIFAIAVDGSREIPLVTHPSHDALLGWSSDGKRLLFASDRGGSMSIWAQPVSDGHPQGAAELLKREVGAAWNIMGLTDGGALFSTTSDPETLSDIRTATIDMGAWKLTSTPVEAVSTYVGSNASPAWSPDGKYLAYLSRRTGVGMRYYVIGIRSTETGSVREIVPSPNFEQPPAVNRIRWAPDGKSLLVAGYSKGGAVVLQVDAQTGNSRTLAKDAVFLAVMGAHGKKLYFMRQGFARNGDDFYRALIEKDMDSGNEKELIRQPNLTSILTSPDGNWITVGLIPDHHSNRASEILAFPTDGGEPRVLMKAEAAQNVVVMTWMPDSRSVHVLRVLTPQKWQRWSVPLGGGMPVALDATPIDGPLPRGYQLHPDGKQVAFVVQSSRKPAEIWALENFLPKGGN